MHIPENLLESVPTHDLMEEWNVAFLCCLPISLKVGDTHYTHIYDDCHHSSPFLYCHWFPLMPPEAITESTSLTKLLDLEISIGVGASYHHLMKLVPKEVSVIIVGSCIGA